MGNGGIYAKRKKQERPKSPRERYEYETQSSSTGSNLKVSTDKAGYEVDRYVRKGSNQKGIDSSLTTTTRRKWERNRNKSTRNRTKKANKRKGE